MLKCRDFVERADGLLDGSLSRRQRLSLRLHSVLCRHCRRYLRQLRALLAAIPAVHPPASDEQVAQVLNCIHERREPSS